MCVKISVVIPCYKCASCLNELYSRLVKSLLQITMNFEIILVNDCSPDEDWNIIRSLAQQDCRVLGIDLSKNYGQHYAIAAGLDFASGDFVVVMDGDLQDRPEEIGALYNRILDGFDMVVGCRMNRKDSIVVSMASRLFYSIFNFLTGKKLDNRIANFGIYNRKVIDAISKIREREGSFGLRANLVGFRRVNIEIEHGNRVAGKSSYSLSKRLELAMNHMILYSNKLLTMTAQVGLVITAVSFCFSLYLIGNYFLFSKTPSGWTRIILAISFFSGLIILSIGILGLYIDKIYNEVKRRPLYIVSETTFDRTNDNIKKGEFLCLKE